MKKRGPLMPNPVNIFKKIVKNILHKFNMRIVRINEFKNVTLRKYENYSCELYNPHEFCEKDKDTLLKFDKFIEANSKLLEFKDRIYHLYYSKKWELGQGVLYANNMFYQSFERLQIDGQRPTTLRFYIYGLDKLLKKEHHVLDIGSNCGFFAMHISEYVCSVDGIEFNKELVDIANATKDYLKIINCNFHYADFRQFTFNKKYDVILSFAVHYWIGMTMSEYSLHLSELLNKNGIVILESQDLNTKDEDFEEKIKEFCKDRFKIIYGGKIMTDKDYPRFFRILLKYPTPIDKQTG
jgi:2-polyprenyl-3-methyl-5-hydroxy-6-metoxy-1,4-benzoquinol methylase